VLRGRCACNAVAYEVPDEFVVAYNCHFPASASEYGCVRLLLVDGL